MMRKTPSSSSSSSSSSSVSLDGILLFIVLLCCSFVSTEAQNTTNATVTTSPVTGAPIAPVTTAPVMMAPVTNPPSIMASLGPSVSPSSTPTNQPSIMPSTNPTSGPSDTPSVMPTLTNSTMPSFTPSTNPTPLESSVPSVSRSMMPTLLSSTPPTTIPSSNPSTLPSLFPTVSGSGSPSAVPTTAPSSKLSQSPTSVPSLTPTGVPSIPAPSQQPSAMPSPVLQQRPTVSSLPTAMVSSAPTTLPSTSPSKTSSTSPSETPTDYPSTTPSTGSPTFSPTTGPPTMPPTPVPVTMTPSNIPSVTLVPTPTATDPPSRSPTGIVVSDTFAIVLSSVTTRMSRSNQQVLQDVSQSFLESALGSLQQPIYSVIVQVTGQSIGRRRLDESQRQLQQLLDLRVEYAISGQFDPLEGQATEASGVNLSRLSRRMFDVQTNTFLGELAGAGATEDKVYFENVVAVRSVAEAGDNTNPNPAPTSRNPEGEGGGGGGLAVGALIAIILCSVLVVLLIMGLLIQRYRASGGMSDTSSFGTEPAVVGNNGNSRGRLFGLGRRRQQQQESQSPQQPSPPQPPARLQLPAGQVERMRSGSESHDGSTRFDLDSMTAMSADFHGGDNTVTGSMSYAYSLEHGIASQSVQYSGGVPTEVPGIHPGMSQDVELTIPKDTVTRECYAPPGRLGIVIDTTPRGPVVHQVHPGSPLEGVLWPGDVIVAIDDNPTKDLAASGITALMARNMNQRRKLTIISEA